MVTFLFFVHTITEAKQYAGLGRAEPGLEPGRWIYQLGHSTFFLKKVDDLFSCRPQNTGRQRRFTVKIKQIKRSDIFIFCSHYYRSKAIRRARQGGARAWAREMDLLARSFDLARRGVAPPLSRYSCYCWLLSVDAAGWVNRRLMILLNRILSLPRVLLVRSTTRCICGLATVAMVTRPAAATSVQVRLPGTWPRIHRNRHQRPVARTGKRPPTRRPDVANAAAAATPTAVRRRRMRLSPDRARSGLRHDLADCATRRRRRRPEEAASVRPIAEPPAVSSRTNTRTSGRCRCQYLANNVHLSHAQHALRYSTIRTDNKLQSWIECGFI